MSKNYSNNNKRSTSIFIETEITEICRTKRAMNPNFSMSALINGLLKNYFRTELEEKENMNDEKRNLYTEVQELDEQIEKLKTDRAIKKSLIDARNGDFNISKKKEIWL